MAEGSAKTSNRPHAEQIKANFSDVKPVLDVKRALVESNKCFFCYDAPCIEACPTSIDIPNFIRMISTGNVKGAAIKIFEENILGGMCARVCPTEILCEDACVRNHSESKPVNIGALQRYATDHYMGQYSEYGQPFSPASKSGKRVAVIGAGPAGLSCAHRLAILGHEIDLFDARKKLGGLNEYGIAAYKTTDNFAQREIDFILGVGNIHSKPGHELGKDIHLDQLRQDYDAIFLAIGLGGVNNLGLDGEKWEGVRDAVSFIADLRQASDKSQIKIGNSVVVIGGGNTAIDAAVQSKRLGAREVTLVYRRGPQHMSATPHEQEFAQINGVKIIHWAMPKKLIGQSQIINAIEFEYTHMDNDTLAGTGETFTLNTDMIFKAIGQKLSSKNLGDLIVENGKIKVDPHYATSIPGIFAGGDCTAFGQDLTVQAVEEGKRAAHAIDIYFKEKK